MDKKIIVLYGQQFGVSIKLPIVCEQHRGQDGTVSRCIMSEGIITERGLICPTCYAEAQFVEGGEHEA